MKKSVFLGVFTLLIVFIGLSFPCHGKLVCSGPAITYFSYLFLWLLVLLPLSLFSLVLSDKKHKNWLIMTGVFFVVGMFFVFMSPEYDSGIVGVDRELVNWFFAGLYSCVSVIYFIIQFIKARK